MSQMEENIGSRQGAGNTASRAQSPCQSMSSVLPVTNGLVSSDVTNSSFSEHPLSDTSGGVLVQPQISGNVADFQNFLDEPSNWEWAVNALPVEPGHSDRNIFVSKLPPTFKDSDLHGMFQNFGHVISAKVMLNVKTGVSKETGFVQFMNHKDALRARAFFRLRLPASSTTPALPEVMTQWAQNRHDGGLYGERCQQVRKLFIRNVPVSITQTHMRTFVSQFGNVSDVSLHSDTYAAAPLSAGRGRRQKQPSASEGTEREEADASKRSSEPEKHETIICFVTFVETEAAVRACREIHNTKPFDACNRVPLMAKLAEDNSSRHARRHQNAAGAKCVPASWGACSPLCDGSSAYSSEAHTPVTGAGGYRRFSHQSQGPAPQHMPQPMLSATHLNTDLSAHHSQSATPQYSPKNARHTGLGSPNPRRAFQQRTTAMSPTSAASPATDITPGSPSMLLTMMPPTPQQPRLTCTRRVPLPAALSMEVTERGVPNMMSSPTTVPAPRSLPNPVDVHAHTAHRSFAGTPVQTLRHRQSPTSAPHMGNYSSDTYADVHTPYMEHQYHQQRVPMNPGDAQGSYGPNGEFYQEYCYRAPMGLMEPNMHPISPSEFSEAVVEYGNTAGDADLNDYQACGDQCDVAPLRHRGTERTGATPMYSDGLAAPARVPHLSPCAACGAPHACASSEMAPSMCLVMQLEGYEEISLQHAKSVGSSPYAVYPQTTVLNGGSQATTPTSGVAGSTRYRNNPYSMRLIRAVSPDSSSCVNT
ncbi:RNA binding protein, putative [Leishmania tarentolae]|uniref:RNA binding protein, putative n=1 Tax=Leishmania tarentolae TaxID=5689 RepID=A0A640KSB3_LEITA|nr:RNA binding protein, putative [Leishmania tarentolae]